MGLVGKSLCNSNMDFTNLNFYLVSFSSFVAVVQHSDVEALLPFMTVECVLRHSLYLLKEPEDFKLFPCDSFLLQNTSE